MNWFLTEFVSPPLQGRLFRGQLSKNTFMTKVGPGTSPATSGQVSGQVGGQVGGEVNGEAGAKPVSVKLDIQHDAAKGLCNSPVCQQGCCAPLLDDPVWAAALESNGSQHNPLMVVCKATPYHQLALSHKY